MKGCLKLPSRAPSPTNDHHTRKTVVFDASGLEQIFIADEWDRTPSEPARNLSYQDILELKAIQRSLPMAQQPADLIGGRPASHYLSQVPIGLLPLLPERDNAPPPTSNVASTMTFSPTSWRTVRTPAPSIPRPQTSTWHPPHLSHLPAAKPPVNRQKPRFAFLPLLETSQTHSPPPSPQPSPPPSERSMSPDLLPSDSDVSHDPPTPSLTNASLDSSPLSRASSCSPEPPFLQLPPSKHLDFKHPPMYPEDNVLSSDRWINSDPHQIRRPGFGASSAPIPIPPTPSTPKRKKNVIYVNDMEIELDDDDDNDGDKDSACEEEGGSTPPAKPPSAKPLETSPPSPSPSPSLQRSNMPPFALSTYPSLSHSPPAPSCHAPILFKRGSPPAIVSPPKQDYTLRQNSPPCGSPRDSDDSSMGGRSSTGGCSSPVLVPSA